MTIVEGSYFQVCARWFYQSTTFFRKFVVNI